jgi:hypothetical protein
MNKQQGIVLWFFFPRRDCIALLDQQDGRIDAIVRKRTMHRGALISYYPQQHYGRYMIDTVMIEDLPLQAARDDILFLHHILELCYQCIPVGSNVDGIFELLMLLYQPGVNSWTVQRKKIFVLQLLMTLGIYPSALHVTYPSIHDLMRLSVDTIGTHSLDLENEKLLDQWLYYCVAEHADIDSLKTVHFLIKNRAA